MRPADTWKDYELLDATDGNRLERWGETILIRPDPQVVWKTPKQSPLWAKADAVYHRSNPVSYTHLTLPTNSRV